MARARPRSRLLARRKVDRDRTPIDDLGPRRWRGQEKSPPSDRRGSRRPNPTSSIFQRTKSNGRPAKTTPIGGSFWGGQTGRGAKPHSNASGFTPDPVP